MVEPRLMDQWFVSSKPLAKRAIEAVENDEVTFVPEMEEIYHNWMNEIKIGASVDNFGGDTGLRLAVSRLWPLQRCRGEPHVWRLW